MIDLRDIHSLSSFQRNAREHIEHMKRTSRPEVLTVNGRAELVVMAAEAYQRFVSLGGRSGGSVATEGSADPVTEVYERHVDRTLLRENLRRTPEERLEALMALQELADEAHRAGRKADG